MIDPAKKVLRQTRRPRKDKGRPRMNDRDRFALRWIGEQYAIRFDQLQRLLVRFAGAQTKSPYALSVSRTCQIIDRWERARLVEYRKILSGQPGWVWLTRRGLFHSGLDLRYYEPRHSALLHLYYVNQCRLLMEKENDDVDAFRWISEREIRAQQEQRHKNRRFDHIPDAIVCGKMESVDIEIELTAKTQDELHRILRGGQDTNALRYFASKAAKTALNTAHKSLGSTARKWIDIHDLEELH
jgi:hypothetical protein